MPNREEFFASPPATVEPGAQCNICLEQMDGRHPLRLPCNPSHVFCKECIEPWARQHRRCTYMCEIRPWDPAPWTEIDPILIEQTRADLIVAARRTFGVPSGTQVDSTTGPFTFGGASVMPLDGQWVRYLQGRDQPDSNGVPVFRIDDNRVRAMRGPGLAETERLLIPVINLANAIPLFAANLGRPYDSTAMVSWNIVVAASLSQLHRPACVIEDIENVPQAMRNKIRRKLVSMDLNVDRNPFLQADRLGSDLDLLLEYVAFTMWRERVVVPVHTPAGLAALQAFARQLRLDIAQFQQATWMLEDSSRQCAIM